MADIVIVGGGPVGLWTAIQLKKRLGNAQVLVYERHAVYQRSHVLRLDHWSLMLYAATAYDSPEQVFLREVTGKSVAGLRARFAKSLYIRTNDFEAALAQYAGALGVEVRRARIENAVHARALHPECKLFIAADGAHSPLRTELFGAEALQSASLQHVLEVKCEEDAGGAARGPRLGTAELWQLNRSLQHTAAEYVGRARDGTVPVTLRLFLDPEEYAQLPDMSFKAPASLETPGLPESVRKDILAYLAARGALGVQYRDGSARLTKLELSLYASRRFATLDGDAAWFLVGDAALGVPYFRALNSGLMLASRLAQILARTDYPQEGSLADKVARYDGFHRPMHVATEFAIARGKNWLLEGLHSAREWLADDPSAQ
jgi:2-polyprenyl-6-methoxyphenol hydroxylase-like FAD-dependent oxidoreductase